MKKFIIIAFILLAKISFASTGAQKAPSFSKEASEDAKIDPSNLPSLGNCDPYSDYYIYQCKPFKCKIPLKNMPGIFRELEIIGYENNLCIHKYKMISKSEKFPPSELKINCRLSEKGRLEIANQFTQYKKGKIEFYTNPPANPVVSSECQPY
jgi:hypothetical protein